MNDFIASEKQSFVLTSMENNEAVMLPAIKRSGENCSTVDIEFL